MARVHRHQTHTQAPARLCPDEESNTNRHHIHPHTHRRLIRSFLESLSCTTLTKSARDSHLCAKTHLKRHYCLASFFIHWKQTGYTNSHQNNPIIMEINITTRLQKAERVLRLHRLIYSLNHGLQWEYVSDLSNAKTEVHQLM